MKIMWQITGAVMQVLNKTGTNDIGLASTDGTFGFFNSCGFDLDREQSTYMALTSRCGRLPGTEKLQANTKLQTLLAS